MGASHERKMIKQIDFNLEHENLVNAKVIIIDD